MYPKEFNKLDAPLPYRRLWNNPNDSMRQIIGPAILQACARHDVIEEHLIDIHVRTGEQLAIKSLIIDDDEKERED